VPHDVDALNAGFAGQLLEQYLENPASVPEEWRVLFESGDGAELLATQPGLQRLLEARDRNGAAAPAEVAPAPAARGRRAPLGAMPTAINASRTANGLTLSGSQKSASRLPASEITAMKPETSSADPAVEDDSALTRASRKPEKRVLDGERRASERAGAEGEPDSAGEAATDNEARARAPRRASPPAPEAQALYMRTRRRRRGTRSALS
jgi:hypothetical protein